MDPNTNTRKQFTTHITSRSIPDNGAKKWKDLVSTLQSLTTKLAHHSAMAPNMQQTYMTPAASKNKVYFHVGFRWPDLAMIQGMAYQVDPTLPSSMSKAKEESWEEIEGRAAYAGSLIADTKKGMLDQMTEMTYPGERGKERPVFGEDILQLAKTL